MENKGPFKKTISLLDLALIGLSYFWLRLGMFAVSNVATQAGPAGSFSWVIGGVIIY